MVVDGGRTKRPLVLVTVAVDKIVVKKPISVFFDVKMVGAVVWVGPSSLEIQLELTQPTQEGYGASDGGSVALIVNFLLVALDSKTRKSAPVNRLMPETGRENVLFKEAEARNKLSKSKRISGQDQKKIIISDNLNKEINLNKGIEELLRPETWLESSLICQPQHRNMHGKVFGGFLMHRAFELAFSTAYAFAASLPCFLEVDRVDFFRPVSSRSNSNSTP